MKGITERKNEGWRTYFKVRETEKGRGRGMMIREARVEKAVGDKRWNEIKTENWWRQKEILHRSICDGSYTTTSVTATKAWRHTGEWRYSSILTTRSSTNITIVIMSRVRGSVTNNNGFWIGFINTFFYNLSYLQSIIALPLFYPLQDSLWHAIRFLATDISQKLSLQITI
jgi:hypothetical protein